MTEEAFFHSVHVRLLFLMCALDIHRDFLCFFVLARSFKLFFDHLGLGKSDL
jgi:hypothetical protein